MNQLIKLWTEIIILSYFFKDYNALEVVILGKTFKLSPNLLEKVSYSSVFKEYATNTTRIISPLF